MKSVVAEASTIAKAVELAWQKADQPKEFLVKVFQEPQRNIFGLTKTTAKVGIFFDDAALTQKIKTASQNTIPAAHLTKAQPNNSPVSRPANARPNNPKPVVKNQPKAMPSTSPTATPITPLAAPATPPAAAPSSSNALPPRRNNNNQPRKPIAPAHPAPLATTQPVDSTILKDGAISHHEETNSVSTIAPRPARSRYYRRRKPKTNRVVGSEGTPANNTHGAEPKNEN